MKALVVTDSGVEVVERPDPEPQAGDVLLEVHSCGICGSDVHLLASEPAVRGQILGHEMSGTVAAVGPGVEGWSIGQAAGVNPLVSCDSCEACKLGYPLMCTNNPNLGISAPGGLAELVVVPAHQLVALPDGVDIELGAHAEPLAVALRAVELADAPPGAETLVYGIGPIGLNVILALRGLGAGKIVAVGRSAGRRAAAAALGADVVLDAREVDVAEYAAEHNLTFPQAYDCSGSPDTVLAITPTLRIGGTIMQLGLPPVPGPVDFRSFVDRSLRLLGSCAYADREYRKAVDLLCSGTVDSRPLVSERIPLQDAPEAFERLRHPKDLVSIVVQPWR